MITFFPRSRTELFIAVGRVVLSAFFLLAIWIDPSESFRYAGLTFVILAWYLIYSILLGGLTWRLHTIYNRVSLLSHAADLIVFAVVMLMTDGPGSPFFIYFIFLLVCATARWQLRGTVWTAVISLIIVVTLAFYPVNLANSPDFELNLFLTRIVYLAVVAVLFGYLGQHEQSARTILARLASWPRTVPEEPEELVRGILGKAAELLEAQRLLVLWEENEEPWLHMSLWTPASLSYDREKPFLSGGAVAEDLADANFFCKKSGDSFVCFFQSSDSGFLPWKGDAINQELRVRYAIRETLVLRLRGERVTGHLLVLDKRVTSIDQVVMGTIVAREVTLQLDQFLLLKELQHSAVSTERSRMVRDLHDGLLQTLAGAVLKLESASQLVGADPGRAQQCIQETQLVLTAEQRALRSLVNEMKSGFPGTPGRDVLLGARLEVLAEQITRQWGVATTISLSSQPPALPATHLRQIYFLVHEALINAVRHASASKLQADLRFQDDLVHISVTDNGIGFPFHGTYDQEMLRTMNQGPVSLRDRIIDLNGTLLVDSRPTGTHLDMTLPIA